MAIIACFGGAYADVVAACDPTFQSPSHVQRFMQHLPTGSAWTRDPLSIAYSLYLAISHEFARVSRRGQDLNEVERDPRTAQEMLSDWERFAGMPRFGLLATDDATRRVDVHRELTYQPNLSPDGIIASGYERGFVIVDVERRAYDTFVCTSKCNDPCRNYEWRFVWRVTATVPASSRPAFETWIRSITPQHSVVEFVYVTAVLQPTIFSPLAQWALGDESGYLATDRSGNGRNLSAVSPRTTPDLREGFHALFAAGANVSDPPTRSDAALRITGALTLTARIWIGDSNSKYIACCAGSGETEANNILYGLYITPSTPKIGYIAESGAGTDITFTPSSALQPDQGQWYFVALRRNSAGTVVTLTLGDYDSNVHETSGVLPAPTGGSSSTFQISDRAEITNAEWHGGISDVCIWDTELSDDTLEILRTAAMGN